MRRAPVIALVFMAVTGCGPEEALPVAHQLGRGDGSPTSVAFMLVLEPEEPLDATDLAFNPDRPEELWVVHRRHPPYVPCLSDNPTEACLRVEGSIAWMANGTEPGSSWTRHQDANAWHFMRLPPAMAFGARGTFGSCGEARTGNFDDGPYDYMGPTLFSSDLAVFGVEPWSEEMNGTHLDMLHASPFCMGIAHERDNVYWVFNGAQGSLDRYDFHADHGPGNDDHSDGEIWHYATGELTRSEGVPSHLAMHEGSGRIFVADTGAGRVVALDPSGARVLDAYEPNYDLVPNHRMTDAAVHVIVQEGELEQPSGLAISGEVLFVSDAATSKLHAFTLDGTPLRSLDTGLPRGTLGGITVGPDDKLYFTDRILGRVFRVEP